MKKIKPSALIALVLLVLLSLFAPEVLTETPVPSAPITTVATTEASAVTLPPQSTAPEGHRHIYTADVTPPSCTDDGFTTYTCACGDSYQGDYTQALGHVLGQWSLSAAPTCTQTGTEERTCDCGYAETREVKATGHDYKYTTVAATADQGGYTEGICQVCGHSYRFDETDKQAPAEHSYTKKDEVALYIHTYGQLPPNFITKSEARKLGWSGGGLEKYAPGMCIGGDRFYNREGQLPDAPGRLWYECDIDTLGKSSRGSKRIVFSNDGLIYYTADHYGSFTLLYGEE